VISEPLVAIFAEIRRQNVGALDGISGKAPAAAHTQLKTLKNENCAPTMTTTTVVDVTRPSSAVDVGHLPPPGPKPELQPNPKSYPI